MVDNITNNSARNLDTVKLSACDSDLSMLVWSYRKKSRDFFNPRYGTLHRIVAARKCQRELTRADIVTFSNNDRFDLSRENIEIISRTELLLRSRLQRPMRDPRFITKVVYQPDSDTWRVIKDNSIHATEADAITHFKELN